MSRMVTALRQLESSDRAARRGPAPTSNKATNIAAAVAKPAGATVAAELDSTRRDAPSMRTAATRFEQSLAVERESDQTRRQYRQLVDNIRAATLGALPMSALFADATSAGASVRAAAQIAIELARRGDGNVLLIDADTQSKTLTQHFALGDEPGVTEFIGFELAWEPLTQPTSHVGLDFLPAGVTALADLPVAAARFARLLHQLQSRYGFLVVAGGAAASGFALAVSRHCDATYAVIELGVCQAEDAAGVTAQLQAAGARLLGCIVTGAPSRE